MLVWDELYGADADGNRGRMMTFFELEDTEEERVEIAELLILKGHESDEIGDAHITMQDIDLEVKIEDYRYEIKALEEADHADD